MKAVLFLCGILAALSNSEIVINAAAVKQIGVNVLHRINSGRAFQLPLSKFAMGGLIGREGGIASVAVQSAMEGMNNFGINLSASVSPEITVKNTFYDNGLKQMLAPWMKSMVDEGYKRNMRDQAKVQSMLMKKFR